MVAVGGAMVSYNLRSRKACVEALPGQFDREVSHEQIAEVPLDLGRQLEVVLF